MGGSGSGESCPAVFGQFGIGAAGIEIAGDPADQTAAFHPGQVVGEPALGPLQAAHQVLRAPAWFLRLASWLAARCPGPVDLIDLAEVNLPLLDEPEPANGGRYQNAHTLAWAARVTACDSFVLLTPEYNASFPAALKNALDYLFDEWNGKPVGLVGYGGAHPAAARSSRCYRSSCTCG